MKKDSDVEVLKVQNLNKSYGEFHALNDVSFTLKKGEIVGLLGHNGAGKSTLIKCIMGTIRSYTGNIVYYGEDIKSTREKFVKETGVLLEPAFVDYLTAWENLYLISKAINRDIKSEVIDEVLEMVSLKKAAKKKVSEFSFGMKQRLGLAQAMLNNPQMIILDEPTVGLDPVGTELIKKTLVEMSKKGVSIMFSSHELQAIEDICGRIIVIEEGKLIYDDSIDKIQTKEIVIEVEQMISDKTLFSGLADQVMVDDTTILVKDISLINFVFTIICSNNLKIIDITSRQNSLFKFFDGGVRK